MASAPSNFDLSTFHYLRESAIRSAAVDAESLIEVEAAAAETIASAAAAARLVGPDADLIGDVAESAAPGSKRGKWPSDYLGDLVERAKKSIADWSKNRATVSALAKMVKCFTRETLVATPDGPRPIGECSATITFPL